MIELNQASVEELQEVKGIGKVTAERIVNYREEKGGFSSLEELKDVSGIGSKSFNKIEDELYVEEKGEVKEQPAEDLVEIRFNPADYELDGLGEVHLVGDMNNWDPADKSYALEKQPDGSWANTFDLEEGVEYKIMYDSISWEEEKHIGVYGANFIVRK